MPVPTEPLGTRRRLLFVSALAPVVLLFAWGSVVTAPPASPVATWWPAAGVSVLALLAARVRWYPAIAVVLLLTTAVGNALAGRDLGVSFLFGLGNTVEAVLVVLLLPSRGQGFWLRSLEDLWALGRALLVAVPVASTLFALVVLLLEDGDPWLTFLTAMPSHVSSILLLVPFGISVIQPWDRRRPHPELVLQVLLLGVTTAMVMVVFPDRPISFALLPLLAWAAMRLPLAVVTTELCVVAVAFLTATRLGRGGFGGWSSDVGAPLLAEAFVISIVLAALPLALSQQQQTETLRQLRRGTQALEEETQFSRSVLSIAADLVVVVREDGLLLQNVRGLVELTGRDVAGMIGQPVWQALAPENRWRKGPERWARIRSSGPGDIGVEVDLLHADGNLRRALLRAVRVPGNDGDLPRYVVVGVDVTRERNAAGLLGHVLDSPSDLAMVGTDLRGSITLFSRGAEMLLAVEAMAARGWPIGDLLERPADDDDVHEAERLSPFEELTRSARDSEVPETRDWLWRRAGEPLLMSTTVSQILDAFGRPVGFLLVGRDVTAKRQAAERQRRLDQAKNEFVWTTSHEIRTPITSISGYIEMLEDGDYGPLNPGQCTAVDAIARNARRLHDLADNVLALTGVDAQEPTRLVPLDLGAVVRGIADDLARQAEVAGVELSVDVAEQDIAVLGSSGALESLVLNLVGNALKFTPQGGRVALSVRVERADAVIEVVDTGIGIAADEVPHVFERFFRASAAHAEAVQGSGLGLAIVASIVEAHQGSVSLDSEPGKGTMVVVRLPRLDAEALLAGGGVPEVSLG